MRIGIILILICLLGTVAANAQQQQSSAQGEVDMLNDEVVRLLNIGRFKEALPIAESALKKCEKASGKDSSKIIGPLKNLGAIYVELYKINNSVETYKRILKLQESQFGQNDKVLIDTLLLLGKQLSYDSDKNISLSTYNRALKIAENNYEQDSKELIPILQSIALSYVDDRKYTLAINQFERLLSLQQKHLGPEHIETAESLIYYSVMLRHSGKIKEADTYDEKVKLIFKSMPASDGPKIMRVSGGVLQGKGIYKVEPVFPLIAKTNRIGGIVNMQITVDEAGFVSLVEPLSGPSELIESSIEAAKQWRFILTTIQGKPVKIQGVLIFNYTLNR